MQTNNKLQSCKSFLKIYLFQKHMYKIYLFMAKIQSDILGNPEYILVKCKHWLNNMFGWDAPNNTNRIDSLLVDEISHNFFVQPKNGMVWIVYQKN